MLNTHKTNLSEKMTSAYSVVPWIIDTEISNHMIRNLKNMCEIHDIQHYLLGLSNE